MTQSWLWGVFIVVLLVLLGFDLGVLHKKAKVIGVKESLLLSAFYITVGLLFGVLVWQGMGIKAGVNYLTGFLVEKTLSMDNVFVISLIFVSLNIPQHQQHRILFWGVLGAIVMRALMIGVGTALVHRYEWVLLAFGVFLIFTGFKMLFIPEKEKKIKDNMLLRFLNRHLRVTSKHHAPFFIRGELQGLASGWWATPAFLALLLVEAADLMFAVDSIPAILAITQDPFIVYTSNIFAILGLRALYFALASMLHRFAYLKHALALVLILIGVKIGLVYAGVDIPASLSFFVTIALLLVGVLYSLWKTKKSTT